MVAFVLLHHVHHLCSPRAFAWEKDLMWVHVCVCVCVYAFMSLLKHVIQLVKRKLT